MNKIWKLAVMVGILMIPILVSAHPGRTSSDGCHYCRTNCDDWGEEYGERHCHGGVSNYKPIFVEPVKPKVIPKPVVKPIAPVVKPIVIIPSSTPVIATSTFKEPIKPVKQTFFQKFIAFFVNIFK